MKSVKELPQFYYNGRMYWVNPVTQTLRSVNPRYEFHKIQDLDKKTIRLLIPIISKYKRDNKSAKNLGIGQSITIRNLKDRCLTHYRP